MTLYHSIVVHDKGHLTGCLLHFLSCFKFFHLFLFAYLFHCFLKAADLQILETLIKYTYNTSCCYCKLYPCTLHCHYRISAYTISCCYYFCLQHRYTILSSQLLPPVSLECKVHKLNSRTVRIQQEGSLPDSNYKTSHKLA